MIHKILAVVLLAFTVSACTSPETPPGTRAVVWRITENRAQEIPFRHLDTVNVVRQTNGLQPLQLSPQLTAAAKTHSADMARQNRPWHFGSDGSSPLDRVARTGYPGIMLGENISETFEDDLETLQAWMRHPDSRSSILDPQARYIGISWFQEPSGKIWWTQVTGS